MTTEQVMEVMKEAMLVAFEMAGPSDSEYYYGPYCGGIPGSHTDS